jgi:hypothetical protein
MKSRTNAVINLLHMLPPFPLTTEYPLELAIGGALRAALEGLIKLKQSAGFVGELRSSAGSTTPSGHELEAKPLLHAVDQSPRPVVVHAKLLRGGVDGAGAFDCPQKIGLSRTYEGLPFGLNPHF